MSSQDWGLIWAGIQAVSVAVTVVIVAATALYARHQLAEAARSRYAQILAHIHGILGESRVEGARRAVMRLPDGFDIASLTDEQVAQIELVTRSFDRVGFYLSNKLIPEEYVLPEYPGALWHWRKLKHYVAWQRTEEGYEARTFFEYMARQTERFRKRRNLPV